MGMEENNDRARLAFQATDKERPSLTRVRDDDPKEIAQAREELAQLAKPQKFSPVPRPDQSIRASVDKAMADEKQRRMIEIIKEIRMHDEKINKRGDSVSR